MAKLKKQGQQVFATKKLRGYLLALNLPSPLCKTKSTDDHEASSCNKRALPEHNSANKWSQLCIRRPAPLGSGAQPSRKHMTPSPIQNMLQVYRNCPRAGFITIKSGQFFSLWSFSLSTSNLVIFFLFWQKRVQSSMPLCPWPWLSVPCVQALPMSRVPVFVVTKVSYLKTSLTPSHFPSFQGSLVKTLQFLRHTSL